MHQKRELIALMSEGELPFSRAERKLISIILQDVHAVVGWSITSLADAAGVSVPTVTRLSRKLGCSGFPEFKLQLASQLSRSDRLPPNRIRKEDGADQVISKVIQAIENSVGSLSATLRSDRLHEAGGMIAAAESVAFMGLGASGSVAQDAQHKFLRIGTNVNAYSDVVNQQMYCAAAAAKDLIVIISYSGQTRSMIELARLAKRYEIPTIGITRSDSILARECRVVLNVSTTDDHDLYTPMTSRIVHLAIIDMLVSMATIHLSSRQRNENGARGQRIGEQVKRIQSAVAKTRQQPCDGRPSKEHAGD